MHHTTVLRNSLCSKYDCIDATDNLESDPSCEIAYLTELYCRLPVVSWRTRKCPWSQMSGIFQISDHGDCRSQSCSAARQGTYHGLDRNAGHKSDKSRFHLSRKKHSESLVLSYLAENSKTNSNGCGVFSKRARNILPEFRLVGLMCETWHATVLCLAGAQRANVLSEPFYKSCCLRLSVEGRVAAPPSTARSAAPLHWLSIAPSCIRPCGRVDDLSLSKPWATSAGR